MLVVKVHDDAPPFAVLCMQYTVRRRLGEEVRVAEELLSRTSPIARAPTAAQPAAQLEPKLWPLSLTMTPMSGERGVELADEVRMWCAQQFVLRAQVVMDKQHVAGRLVEGHWGVERGDERDNPHGQGANLANLAVIGQKQAESDVKAWYRTLVDALKKEVIKEFEAHALEDPEKFANRKVTLRLSVNLNKNYAYVQGYTGKWWQNDEYRESRTGINDERWQYCVDKYNAGANDEQNFRAVVKKPYNPRVGSGKLNQINKTNFIGSVVDFLIVSGLLKYFPTLVVAVAWMLQSGRFILSPVFVQARRGACVQMHLCVHACIALLHVHASMHLGAQGRRADLREEGRGVAHDHQRAARRRRRRAVPAGAVRPRGGGEAARPPVEAAVAAPHRDHVRAHVCRGAGVQEERLLALACAAPGAPEDEPECRTGWA